MINNKYRNSILKSFISFVLFQIAYVFVFTSILRQNTPLMFLANNGMPFIYVLASMLIGGIPYIICGYLIMLARNSTDDLENKNKYSAMFIFIVSASLLLAVSIYELVSPYSAAYSFYVSLNFPVLRSLYYIELSNIHLHIVLIFSTIIAPIFFYIGGQLRLKHFQKGSNV